MKKLFILVTIALLFAGCKKDDVITATMVELKDETIEKGWDYLKISAEYSYPEALKAVNIYLSENSDMSGAEVYECNLDGKKISLEVKDLKDGLKYYYHYEYDNGYEKKKGEKREAMTFAKPVVSTSDIVEIKATSATTGGNVISSDNVNKIKARGVCWSTKQNPTTADSHTDDGSGTGSFTSQMTGLTGNTTYYVRAYATNENGTVYGEEKSFVTNVGAELPTVTTQEVLNITINSAECGGEVISDGGFEITARGVCWSTSQNPTIADSHTTDGNGTGSFTSQMTGLTANTTYYVRAYATNEMGTAYGEERGFTTLNEYDWVDLGLQSGLKWATCNIGAENPEDYGYYYAWGETETKSTYTEENSITYGVDMQDISGNPEYDAATANWGSTWRMPTEEEFQELLDRCTWQWTTQNGVHGQKVTGPNGNYIFLPAAGYREGSSLSTDGYYGNYWASTPNDPYGVYDAYYLNFNYGHEDVSWSYRYYGRSVRPVTE